ncbi:MAG: hypothetical protein JWO06_2260 [Bacteroidota bacterium]|nr:hypothetical protein [Bacteroidota bacterium]
MRNRELRKLRWVVTSLIILTLVLSTFNLRSEIDSLYQKGNEQFNKNQFDSASVYFDELVSEFPLKKEGYFNRGLCFYRLQQYDKAISDFEKCIQIDSVFKEAKFLKALSLQKKGELKKAYTEFEKLNTTYTGYNGANKHVRNYQLAVILSKNWYYMLAIMFMIIILFAVVAKTYTFKR